MLNSMGFDEVRVRHYGDRAKIEVPSKQLDLLKKNEEAIKQHILDLGFEYCDFDEEGLVSGKLNRAIA